MNGIWIPAALYACALAGALMWLGSRQKTIARTPLNACRIAIRLAAPFVLLWAATTIFSLAFLWGLVGYVLFDFLAGAMFGAPGMVTLMLVEWVLGWPGYPEWPERYGLLSPRKTEAGRREGQEPRPPTVPVVEKPHQGLVGRRGTTVTRLAPTGKVRVDDRTVEAKAEDVYIPANAEVEVVETGPFGVTVRPCG